jgi:hypothetical protein
MKLPKQAHPVERNTGRHNRRMRAKRPAKSQGVYPSYVMRECEWNDTCEPDPFILY